MAKLKLSVTVQDIQVLGKGANPIHKPYSPSGLVPVLIDHTVPVSTSSPNPEGLTVWDTIAIAEYLYEKHPTIGIFPTDPIARAYARCIMAEMHSGFTHLRSGMPCNIKFRCVGLPSHSYSEGLLADIQRIEEIWSDARIRFAGTNADGTINSNEKGPYLFGTFTTADAYYAPVVWRFNTYNVQLQNPVAKAYMLMMLNDECMKEWEREALAEGDEKAIAHYDESTQRIGGDRR